MKRNLSARIAWRYLRAPKSHSAVNAISLVSVSGVAVATAAIVCVLSVFNGFQSLLTEKFDTLAPDVLVTPAEGKVFNPNDSVLELLSSMPNVAAAVPTLTDNALAIAGDREMPVLLKGVDFSRYPLVTGLDSLLAGQKSPSEMEPGEVSVAIGVAHQLGLFEPGMSMLVFAPKREGRVNMANPMSSFITDSVSVASVFEAQQSDYDGKMVIADMGVVSRLFDRDGEYSAVELAVSPGASPAAVATAAGSLLGGKAIVRDRMKQQDTNFRMVEIEKWVTFLLLVFILIIASFNIISTMNMLVLEKEGTLKTLRSLGFTSRGVGRIFWWESLYVSIGGALAGIILGLALCLLQQHCGIIKLGGDPEQLVLKAYPVEVVWTDVLIAFLPALAIGLAAGVLTWIYAEKKAR